MGENKPDCSGGGNQEEALELDRTHIEESTQLRHKTSPHVESSRPKEKRKVKEHITPGNGDRHEKNEQELDGTRKEGPGQKLNESRNHCETKTSSQPTYYRNSHVIVPDKEFEIILNIRFQAIEDQLKEGETAMKDGWKWMKETLDSTCREVLGLNKHHNNGWIFIETLGRIQERKNKKITINDRQARTEKVKPQTEYTEANKQVKRSIRADKKKYDSRKASRGGNIGKICDRVKKLTMKYRKSER
ncbi:unnamed protein product [Schistosoma curassoni]|uniref:Uncharacterized protein n=1 Tax=Schistosoma curassoni TaxID=6186 RepID=A0A183KU63_9TREM|nr:unnamed protein product [Schistosoma curassoni]